MADEQWIPMSQTQDDSQWQPLSAPQAAPSAMPTVGDASMTEGSTSPQAAAPASTDSELPFGEQVMMSLAEKPASQMKYLQTMYGKENVRVGARGFEFNDGATWRSAQPGVFASLIAQGPEALGGAVGAIGGTLGGAALTLNPLGAAAGGMGGRAIGSALMHAVKEWGVEALGLKTKEDVRSATDIMASDTVLNLAIDAALNNPMVRVGTLSAAAAGGAYGYATAEPGQEMENAAKYAAAGGAIGLAGSVGVGATKTAINAVKEGGISKLGANMITKTLDVVKRDMVENAKALAAVSPGTKEEDWLVLNRSADDAKKIVGMTNEVQAFQNQAAKGQATEILDPSAREMVARTGSLMEGIKKRVNTLYDQDKALLEGSEAFNAAEIQADDLFGGFTNKLAQAGLLEVDKVGNYAIRKGVDASGNEIASIANGADLQALDYVVQQINALKKAHTRPISGALESGGGDNTVKMAMGTFIPVKKALQFRRMIDDVLEQRNAFGGGQDAVGSQAAGMLKQMRGDIVNKATDAVKEIPVGRTPTNDHLMASDVMKRMNEMYTTFRDQFDNLALPSKLGRDENALNTVDKMLDRKGATVLNTFAGLIENAAQGDKTILQEGARNIQRLQQLRASRNFSSTVAKSTGMGAVIKSKLGMNPYDMMSSSAARMTPATPQDKLLVNGWARAGEFVKTLTPQQKTQMMSTPALREFLKTIYGSAQQFDQTQEAMFTQAQGKMQGQ